ncbi:MAG: hypothetical protein COA99_18360 [Moraxellaceae bacterium]|nr:MAG: hypothetical protein COA99_18360 [Moraxellaceae bacterium]
MNLKKTVLKNFVLKEMACTLCLLLLSSFTFAAGDIVVVDMRAAILTSDKGVQEAEKLKATLAREEASLLAIQDELKALKERMDKDSAIMGAEERQSIEEAGADKMADFQFQRKKLQKKVKDAEQRLFQSILPDFERALKTVMEEKKYGMILRREVALFVVPEQDITEQVIAKMNKQK